MISTLAACLALPCNALPDERALISVERIWDRAAHNAFTDLVERDGALYCAFREGSAHVFGTDGVVRVLRSEDGQNWRSVALLAVEEVDLRDPKLCVLPDGRVLVVLGGSYYDGRTLVRRQPHVAFSTTAGEAFSDPEPARIDPAIRTEDDWLWRVTWHGDAGYGVVYAIGKDENVLHLVRTRDGREYEHVSTLPLTGKPNETTLRFLDDGTLLAVVRREAGDRGAQLGRSAPPYTEWSFQELGVRVGGPNLIVAENERWIVGGRRYREGGQATALGVARPAGGFEWALDLPSGGDTSYPGFVLRGDELLVSYYSSHEGKAAIYLARVRWRRLPQ